MTARRAVCGAVALMMTLQVAAAQDRPPDGKAAAIPAERPAERPASIEAQAPEGTGLGPNPEAHAAPPGAAIDFSKAVKDGPERPPADLEPRDTATATPAEHAGPPAHTLLREDDFAFAACRLELAMLGTKYTQEAPVTNADALDCGIDRPLKVTAILPGVTLEGGALMRCDTARALAWWMRDVVQPAARRLPGAPRVTAVAPGSTYQCRATVGASTTRLSEHALGNAIDIASFSFDDGTTLPVEAPEAGSASQAFLLAVRWAACMTFTTVLGPGSNAAHEGHLHLDIKQRSRGYWLCE